MNNFFQNVKVQGKKALIAGEVKLIENKISKHKKEFGIEVYDFCHTLTSEQDFYATDDHIIALIRPLLVTADKDIKPLDSKKGQVQEEIAQTKVDRESMMNSTAGGTFQDKMKYTMQSTMMAGSEAAGKTKAFTFDKQMQFKKEKFGEELYPVLEDAFKSIPIDPSPEHCEIDKHVNTIKGIYSRYKVLIDELVMEKFEKEKSAGELS